MLIRVVLVITSTVGLLSCASDAELRREEAARQIKVILYDYPQCNYRLVGAFTTNVESSEYAAIQEAKLKAVDVGAEFLSIMSMGKYALDRTNVSGKAFVCESQRTQD